MKYFIDGLTKEELKKEYKTLAKKYHPDICKEAGATAIMAEINKEYDEYFSSLTPNINTTHNWAPSTEQRSSKKSKDPVRRSVVWMFKEKTYDDSFKWSYRTMNDTGRYFYETFVSNDDESWKGFNGGPCVVEYDIYSLGLFRTCKRIKEDIKMPSFDQLIETVYEDRERAGTRFSVDDFNTNSWRSRYSNLFYHIRKGDEEFLVIGRANNNSIVDGVPETTIKDKVVDVAFSVGSDMMILRNLKASMFKSYEVIDVYWPLDFVFLKYTGYRANQFADFYDLDDFPEFFTEKVDPDNISDRTAHFYAKRDIVRFRSMKNHQDIRFGCFNIDILVKNLPNIDMNDIDDIQDYLNIVNDESDKKIRAMIKKGKIGYKV